MGPLTVVQDSGAVSGQPGDDVVRVVPAGAYVEVDPVLDRLALRNLLKEDPGSRPGVRIRMADGGAGLPDKHSPVRRGVVLGREALTDHVEDEVGVGRLDIPLQRFCPPLGKGMWVGAVDGDLEAQGHATTLRVAADS